MLLQLSQSQLTLIEQCPRKFQYIYLDQLTAPIPTEQREHLTRGSQLHHLMQQHELQLPAEMPQGFGRSTPLEKSLLEATLDDSPQQIYQMVKALTTAVPMADDTTVFRQSEYRVTLDWSDALLTAIYDLLVLDASQAHIFDWKTYLKPPNLTALRQRLATHWQTKLYPFVLVETSDYSPKAVDITYWFVKRHREAAGSDPRPDLHSHNRDGHQPDPQTHIQADPPIVHTNSSSIDHRHPDNPFEPECLTFPYSDRLHQHTKQDLTHIIGQVQQWLEEYQHSKPLPQVDLAQGLCAQCSFQMRCDRLDNQTDPLNWEELGNIDTIPEVQPFQNPGQ